MRGKVLGFDNTTGRGVISGDDGRRYSVTKQDLQGGAKSLFAGGTVDFETEDARAVSVFPISTGGLPGEKNKWVAALLAFFFGALGAHKFYLGRTREGIIMLLCFFPGMLLILPLIASGIIAFVEMIIYLAKDEQTFHEDYVVGQKGWF